MISALAAVGAPLIMRIYTFRVDDPVLRAQQLELATFLLRWFAPQIFFYGVSAIAEALLNVRGRFGAAEVRTRPEQPRRRRQRSSRSRAWSAAPTLELDTTAKMLLGAGTTAGVVAAGDRAAAVPARRTPASALRLPRPVRRARAAAAVFVIGYVAINQIGLWVVLALANGVRGGVTHGRSRSSSSSSRTACSP